jgi:hypothetical protein
MSRNFSLKPSAYSVRQVLTGYNHLLRESLDSLVQRLCNAIYVTRAKPCSVV